jgi:hypothetical protein
MLSCQKLSIKVVMRSVERKQLFLSKSEGVFVSFLGILMAYTKDEAQEKHDKFTWQSGMWGFHDKH